LFLIEHPHRFATVASGLLGWRLSRRTLDAFECKYMKNILTLHMNVRRTEKVNTIMQLDIQPCTKAHLDRYGEIYARAFSGEPWNNPWSVADATVRVRELLENAQSYGLECVLDGKVAGLIIGTSQLFHFGRTFDISDLAVDPEFQGRGIGTALLERCLSDLKEQGITAVHLITECEGFLPAFYGKYGFSKAQDVMLMGADI